MAHSMMPMRFLMAGACLLAVGACSTRLPASHAAPRIPAEWINLPEAPFHAELAGSKAVLVNRTGSEFNTLEIGCAVENDGRVRIVGKLLLFDVFDSSYRPGATLEEPFATLHRLDRYGANAGNIIGRPGVFSRCPVGSMMTVVAAGLRGGPRWSADGTRWPGQ